MSTLGPALLPARRFHDGRHASRRPRFRRHRRCCARIWAVLAVLQDVCCVVALAGLVRRAAVAVIEHHRLALQLALRGDCGIAAPAVAPLGVLQRAPLQLRRRLQAARSAALRAPLRVLRQLGLARLPLLLLRLLCQLGSPVAHPLALRAREGKAIWQAMRCQ